MTDKEKEQLETDSLESYEIFGEVRPVGMPHISEEWLDEVKRYHTRLWTYRMEQYDVE